MFCCRQKIICQQAALELDFRASAFHVVIDKAMFDATMQQVNDVYFVIASDCFTFLWCHTNLKLMLFFFNNKKLAPFAGQWIAGDANDVERSISRAQGIEHSVMLFR